MWQVTPVVVLLFFALVVLAAGAIAWGAEPTKYNESRTFVFLAALTGLGLITISVVYYLSVVDLNHAQRRLYVVGQTARLHKLIGSSVQDAMTKAAPTIPRFVASVMGGAGGRAGGAAGGSGEKSSRVHRHLGVTVIESHDPHAPRGVVPAPEFPDDISGFPDQRLDSDTDAEPDPDTVSARAERRAVSNKIFMLWQELLTAHGYTDLEPAAYLTVCLQQASSPYLREEWGHLRHNYNRGTQKFGELLFDCASEAGAQSGAEYRDLAEKLEKDKRFRALLR